nr:unnamed protein product [Spirometra erinaceieuropaei]
MDDASLPKQHIYRDNITGALQSQPDIWPAASLRVRLPQHPTECQTENIQRRRPDDTPVRSGDLDSLLKPCQEPQLLRFNCFFRILKLRWQNRIPSKGILKPTGIPSIHVMLRQLQLRWSGHLGRIDDARLPKQYFYGDAATGARRPEGPKPRHKDTLKNSLKRLHNNQETWKDLAQNGPAWSREVKNDAAIHEANRFTTAKAEM